VPLFLYAVALTFTTWSILSIGFLIASIVPTARFAQPLAAIILYPMIVVSGLFFPVSVLPQWMQAVAGAMPLGYAVSLLDGIWRGEGWSAHVGEVAALTLFFLVFTAISSRVFRWE
jgi:ABC-2 type transport system permease protein